LVELAAFAAFADGLPPAPSPRPPPVSGRVSGRGLFAAYQAIADPGTVVLSLGLLDDSHPPPQLLLGMGMDGAGPIAGHVVAEAAMHVGAAMDERTSMGGEEDDEDDEAVAMLVASDGEEEEGEALFRACPRDEPFPAVTEADATQLHQLLQALVLHGQQEGPRGPGDGTTGPTSPSPSPSALSLAAQAAAAGGAAEAPSLRARLAHTHPDLSPLLDVSAPPGIAHFTPADAAAPAAAAAMAAPPALSAPFVPRVLRSLLGLHVTQVSPI
jgi:hypothetical protein